jgi:SAM-dependent methyltransferase
MQRSNKVVNPRLLIARLRDGDYAHAGEEEAIDLVLQGISELTADGTYKNSPESNGKLKVIDIGCGLGGTANYIKNTTNYDVFGIDIDRLAIDHAQGRYPGVRFFSCDVLDVKSKLPFHQFDLVYMFNAFYAFSNQTKALEALAEITRKSGLLVIFDYTYQNNHNSADLTDLAGNPMDPIITSQLETALKETGWDLIKVVQLHNKYEEWYTVFLERLHKKRSELLDEFSEEAYIKVESTFQTLLDNIKKGILGGSIVYAKLK